MKDNTLTSRMVIISGGTKGLGRSLSFEFARRGYEVVALFKSDEKAAQEMRHLSESQTLKIRCLKCNVTQFAEVQEISRQVSISGHQEVQIVHNACLQFQPKPMHLIEPDEYRAQSAVSAEGAFHLFKVFIKDLMACEQKLFSVILTEALRTQPRPKGFSAYLSGKAALQEFTESLKSEFTARGLAVHSFFPGYMDTDLTQNWDPRFRQSALATADQVAQAIVSELCEKRG